MAHSSVLYCKNHPDRETSLRCNRCGEPICSQCAQQTPTGYRCPECVRDQKKVFNTAKSQDYFLAFGAAAIISYIGAFIAARIGFFTILLAPAAGTIIAEAVRSITAKRRSRTLYLTTVAGIIVGALPFILSRLLVIFFGAGLAGLIGILWPGLYLFLASSSAYYRLSGIQIKR
jgi:hypothetical protein